MSTGEDCTLVEYLPGEWYNILGSEINEMVFGPYPDEDSAYRDVADVFGNPGGCVIVTYDPEGWWDFSDEVSRARYRP